MYISKYQPFHVSRKVKKILLTNRIAYNLYTDLGKVQPRGQNQLLCPSNAACMPMRPAKETERHLDVNKGSRVGRSHMC